MQLHLCVFKFILSCIEIKNECVHLCTQLIFNGSQSSVCNTLISLCHSYGLCKTELVSKKFVEIKNGVLSNIDNDSDDQEVRTVAMIRELLNMRIDNENQLTYHEIDESL